MAGKEPEETLWQLYILHCGDDTLYTGITNDLARRLDMHRAGKGAKYTRGRGPLKLVFSKTCGSHSDALREECRIKALSRDEKLAMIEGGKHDIS